MFALLLACALDTVGIDEDPHGIPRAELAGCTVTTLEPPSNRDPFVEGRLSYDENGHPMQFEERVDGGDWVEVSWIETDLDGQGRPVEQVQDDVVRSWTYGEGWRIDTYEETSDAGTYTETWSWTNGWEIFRDVELADGTPCTDEGELAQGIRSLKWTRTCDGVTSVESRDWEGDRLKRHRVNGEVNDTSTLNAYSNGFPLTTRVFEYDGEHTRLPGELLHGDHTWDCP